MGCADHINLIQKKRLNGSYLHDLLISNCSRVIGLDSNIEALHAMRVIGIRDLYETAQFNSEERFDYLLIPDVIEHVGNVSDFLSSLRRFNVAKYVFTTPNAYRLTNRLQIRSELINTDHRYWFSPYTLAKTLYENGFVIELLELTDVVSWRHPFAAFLKSRYPLCRDGLAVVAQLAPLPSSAKDRE